MFRTSCVRTSTRQPSPAPIRPILRFMAGVFAAFAGAAASAEEGMWLLNKTPNQALRSAHNFEPKADWLERMQKSAVNFGGGSGSFVSPRGLVMTNHHVGSDIIARLSTAERNLMRDGFLARSQDQELRCEGVELTVLISIQDVTQRVLGAGAAAPTPGERLAAQRREIAAIAAESENETGLDSEVVTLFQGGQFHLYRSKRYTDVRLVWAPEESIAFFGGDTDNFEFPRYCLDACFFRVYEDGKPATPPAYLEWNADGAKEGDLVFVFGHPGRTRRLYTVAHTEFARDVELPMRLHTLWRREVQLRTFMARSAENARTGREDFFGVQNSRKAFTGMLAALHDPAVMAAKVQAEQALIERVSADAALKADAGDAWARIAAAQAEHRKFFRRYQTIRSVLMRSGDALRHAATIVQLTEELAKPAGERLPEYAEANLESVYHALYAETPFLEALEIDRLASGLSLLAEQLGGSDPRVVEALAGKSPRERAVGLIKGTILRDPAKRRALVEGGESAVRNADDALLRVASNLDFEWRFLRKRIEEAVEGPERQAYAAIARARFAVSGDAIYPDATGTLRMSYGTIRGHADPAGDVPAFTSIAGTFERERQFQGQDGFEVPASWRATKASLRDVPFNFLSTCDIIGGNSGSPTVDREGRVVGLVFDGNIHSLGGDFVYDGALNRAVHVDARAIIEALRTVYQADALVEELLGR